MGLMLVRRTCQGKKSWRTEMAGEELRMQPEKDERLRKEKSGQVEEGRYLRSRHRMM